MCVYERYVGKKVKIVWKDNYKEKAVVGVLINANDGFLTVKAVPYKNIFSINKESVITISEYAEVSSNDRN